MRFLKGPCGLFLHKFTQKHRNSKISMFARVTEPPKKWSSSWVASVECCCKCIVRVQSAYMWTYVCGSSCCCCFRFGQSRAPVSFPSAGGTQRESALEVCSRFACGRLKESWMFRGATVVTTLGAARCCVTVWCCGAVFFFFVRWVAPVAAKCIFCDHDVIIPWAPLIQHGLFLYQHSALSSARVRCLDGSVRKTDFRADLMRRLLCCGTARFICLGAAGVAKEGVRCSNIGDGVRKAGCILRMVFSQA